MSKPSSMRLLFIDEPDPYRYDGGFPSSWVSANCVELVCEKGGLERFERFERLAVPRRPERVCVPTDTTGHDSLVGSEPRSQTQHETRERTSRCGDPSPERRRTSSRVRKVPASVWTRDVPIMPFAYMSLLPTTPCDAGYLELRRRRCSSCGMSARRAPCQVF